MRLVIPRNNSSKYQHGFTILEIMIATTVFGIILLILTAGILSFARNYFASITRSTTQSTARSIVEDITRSIQFAGKNPTIQYDADGIVRAVCIGNVAYFTSIGTQLSKTSDPSHHKGRYGLIKRVASSTINCADPSTDLASGYVFDPSTDQELLAQNTRLADLLVDSSGDGKFTIHARVVYGDDDLVDVGATPDVWSDLQCRGGVDSQYCAVSDLTTSVQRRLE